MGKSVNITRKPVCEIIVSLFLKQKLVMQSALGCNILKTILMHAVYLMCGHPKTF